MYKLLHKILLYSIIKSRTSFANKQLREICSDKKTLLLG